VPHMQAPFDRQALVLAAGCVAASKQYRTELLRALPQQSLHLTGDVHWQTLLPEATCHPTTDYGEASAAVYRDTVISVNATNLQMPSTVNQRVFDVPATGGFLITDHQAEMDSLYDCGPHGEMVTYTTAQELAELVAHYAAHPAERQAMAARARRRVLAHHTYTHRMRALVATMRAQHASMAQGAVASPKTN
jgi:spore maturation protein CgeB